MAKRIPCAVEHAMGFELKVIDGRSLTSQGKCSGVKVFIEVYEFITNLFLLPLDRCDLVLGDSTIEEELHKDALNEDQVVINDATESTHGWSISSSFFDGHES